MIDFDFERQERRERRRKIFFRALGWTLALGIAVAAAAALNLYAIEITNMVGNSMEPTLSADDMIVIDKLSYLRKTPERSDVIVFTRNGSEHSYYCIARVVGLPGETVTIRDGIVYIDGQPYQEYVNTDPIQLPGLAAEGVTLDEDEYFVLSDNRNSGQDSRYSYIGNVVAEDIIGKALIRTNRFAIIDKLNVREYEETEEE